MGYLLAVLVLAVGFLLYCAWELICARRGISRSARRLGGYVAPCGDGLAKPFGPRRALERITAGQFPELLARTENLVLIDLRPAHQNAPLPVRVPHAVRVPTSQLEDVLRNLPEDRSAVFYGASDLSLFMITTSLYMRGSAPLYVLRPEPAHEEAA